VRSEQLIFGGNAARMYRINLKAADNIRMPTFSEDRLAALKSEYELVAKSPRICVTATSGPPDRGLGFLPNASAGIPRRSRSVGADGARSSNAVAGVRQTTVWSAPRGGPVFLCSC